MVSIDADKWAMFVSLGLIAIGTGLFKGNLQVLVGNLYDDPKLSDKRDSAFSLFYMAINIGAMFAPAMAKALYNPFIESAGFHFVPIDSAAIEYGAQSVAYLESLSNGYRLCFYAACAAHLLSYIVYLVCRPWFKYADVNVKQAKSQDVKVQELTPKQTKYITSQNHGYAVIAESLKGTGVETFVNANDGSCEGMEYPGRRCFTVQFHPEACAGPKDTGFLFDRFIAMMEGPDNA